MPGFRRTLAIWLLPMLPLFTACAKEDPTAFLPQTLRIAAAEARWRAGGLKHYSFNSTVACYCIEGYSAPKRVTVRNGLVTSVVDRSTGASHPVAWRQPIDSLFVLARREAISLPSLLEVTFDSRLGYPRRLSYGQQAIDAGGVITIDSLRADP